MLPVATLEKIQDALLRVPALVQALEDRELSFGAGVDAWLVEMERLLTDSRLLIASEVAVLRGTLITIKRGVVPEGLSFSGRSTKAKVRDAAAMQALQEAQALVTGEVKVPLGQVAEAERMARMLLASAAQKGLLPDEKPATGEAAWKALVQDDELRQGLAHLTGLVGAENAVAVVSRVLPTLG